MKNKKLQIMVLTCLCLALAPALQAQPTPAEAQDLRDETLVKMNTFMLYLEMIAKEGENSYDEETKQMAIDRVKGLFDQGATIKVSSAGQEKIISCDLEEYLQSLKDGRAIGKEYLVDIMHFKPADLKPVPNSPDMYSAIVASGHSCRYFFDESGEVSAEYLVNNDAVKLSEIVVKKQFSPVGTQWIMLLGDLYVTE